MPELPRAGDDLSSLLIRTDFSDGAAWVRLKAAITAPAEFRAYLTFIDEQRYEGLTIPALIDLAADDGPTFVFLADRVTMSSPDQPVVVVDLSQHPGRFFRVVPSELWVVQNNLAIGNMDWEDFADSVDGEGVFRGHGR